MGIDVISGVFCLLWRMKNEEPNSNLRRENKQWKSIGSDVDRWTIGTGRKQYEQGEWMGAHSKELNSEKSIRRNPNQHQN